MRIADFKQGNNWCYQFMRRNTLRIRMKISIDQKVPIFGNKKLKNLYLFKDLVKNENYSLNLNIKVDEVSLAFDCPKLVTKQQAWRLYSLAALMGIN